MPGVDKTLEVVATVEDLTMRLVALSKSKSILSFFTAAPAIFSDVQLLAKDAAMVMPELSDLDADEFGKLGKAAYSLVLHVVMALKA